MPKQPATSPSFSLTSSYAPAGHQPEAIQALCAGIQKKQRHQTLLGVTGSGKTFTIANVVEKLQRPTLVLAQNKTLAAQLAAEFRGFFPENAVHYFVSYYDYYQPEAYIAGTDTYIEKDASINEEIDRFRHAATHALLTRRDVLIVATVSCIYGLGNVEDYEALAFTLALGEHFNREKLLRRLVDMQYTRAHMDFKRGQFAVNGETIDIHPPDEEDTIIRLEFFGDELERITRVVSFTGEVLGEMKEVTIFPAKHAVTTKEKIDAALPVIRTDLDDRYAELMRANRMLEAERLKSRTEYDMEMLQEVGYVSGIENYTRYFSGLAAGQPSSTLLDYFPDDYLLFIDESHVSVPQIGAMYGGNFTRKQNLIDYGFRLPSAHDNRPLSFEEFEARMGQTVFVSATPATYEKEHAKKNIVEMIVRPTGLLDPAIEIVPIAKQASRCLSEITAATEKGNRVLITTLTKKSAESLTEFLSEKNIKVKYLHSDVETLERIDILRKLRLGEIDVVVGINLLREGLDLPEVSTVLILDADKEGFLRSTTSLIQTIGRAARHLEGKVVLFADKITAAMREAIDETDRRRKIQKEFNKKHSITPASIKKAVHDISEHKEAEKPAAKRTPTITPEDIPYEEIGDVISRLEQKMDLAAQEMRFEEAAELRDQVETLRTLKNKGRQRVKKK